MQLTRKLMDSMEARLREGDDGLGFWGWFALVVLFLTGLTVFVGVVLAFDHVDNIGTSLVGLVIGSGLLALSSPGWAGTMAVRRHRRRLARRHQQFGGSLQLAEQLFAMGRIKEVVFEDHRQRLRPLLAGTAAGDAAKVAATWLRFVALTAGLFGAGLAVGGGVFLDGEWQADDRAYGTTAVAFGTLLVVMAVVSLVLAAGLAQAARHDNRQVVEAAQASHEALLRASAV